MRKIVKIIVLILVIILLTVGISTVKVQAVDQTRGVNTVIEYKPDAKPPVVDTPYWHRHLVSHTSWICAQHPAPLPKDVNTPTVIFKYKDTDGDIHERRVRYNLNSTVAQIAYEKNSSGSYDWKGTSFKFNLGSGKEEPEVKLTVEKYPIKDRIAPMIFGNLTSGYAKTAKVHTLGRNMYTKVKQVKAKNGKNSALAYILAEGAYNGNTAEGTDPADSYVNVAFWQAKDDPDATSEAISSSYLNQIGDFGDTAERLDILNQTIAKLKAQKDALQSNYNQSASSIKNLKEENQELTESIENLEYQYDELIEQRDNQNNQNNDGNENNEENENNESGEESGENIDIEKMLADIQAEIEEKKAQIASNKQLIKWWEDLRDEYSSVSADLEEAQEEFDTLKKAISGELSTVSSGATSLWQEAKDFGTMWKEIDEAGGYKNTIINTTNKSQVTVVYDAKNKQYEIGPLSVVYLEYYTGVVKDKSGKIISGTQLCGMTGKPVLIARIRGKEQKLTLSNGDWEFVYKAPRPNKSPSQYNNNPHSGETFYIRVKQKAGLEQIKRIQFNFRYLEAEGSYTLYRGDAKVVEWEANANYTKSGNRYRNASVTIGVKELKNTSVDTQDIGYNEGAKRYYTPEIKSISWNITPTTPTPTPTPPTTTPTSTPTPTPTPTPGLDLTTCMSGNVWLEDDPQKNNNRINGIKDAGEAGISNIPVTIYIHKEDGTRVGPATRYDESGNELSWPVYTDSNGYWKADRLEIPELDDANCFFVAEFEYNGQAYRPTVFLGNPNSVTNDVAASGTVTDYMRSPNTYQNSSMVYESPHIRQEFDQKTGIVTGNQGIQDNGNTTGQGYSTDAQGAQAGGAQSTVLNYTSHSTGNGIESVLDNTNNSWTLFKSSTYYNDAVHSIQYPFSDGDENRWTLLHTTGENETSTSIGPYMEHVNLGLCRRNEVDMSVLKDLYKVTVVVNEQKLTKQFNYLKDVDSSYTAAFNFINEKRTNANTSKYALGLYGSDLSYQSYTRYQNAIDEVYNIKKDSELRVYASYVIRVYNNSESNAVEINELKDYYDKSYTLVQQSGDFYNLDDNEKYAWENNQVMTSLVDEKGHRNKEMVAEAPYYRILTSGSNCQWAATKEENLSAPGVISSGDVLTWQADADVNGHNASKTVGLDNTKLLVNQYAEIFTTYEIDKAGYDAVRTNTSQASPDEIRQLRSVLQDAQDKNNIAEISSYSTYYGQKDGESYYGADTGYDSAKGYGNISGRIDKDSAPNNIPRNNIKNKAMYEDDTDMSIPLKVSVISEEIERTMTGIVWEDDKTENEKYNIKASNGKHEGGEQGTEGVEVSMYEVINLGDVANQGGSLTYNADYDVYDYYYKVPNEFYNNGTGAVTTDNSGQYTLKGFLPGNYILRFDYGKNKDSSEIYKYNGQDYENTKFMAGYSMQDWLNAKYLDITDQTVHLGDISVARDNESRRLIVDSYSKTIENSNAEILRDKNSAEFKEATQMFAETPVMQIEIRDPKTLTKEANGSGDYTEKVETLGHQVLDSSYLVNGINFGLEKRATTDMELVEYIQRIMLFKQDELILQADLGEDGKVIQTAENTKGLDKMVYIPHSIAVDESAGLYQQGFYSVEIENEYLSDMELVVKYKMRAVNNSEVDFTGRIAEFYKQSDIKDLATRTPTDYYTNAITNNLANEVGISSNATLDTIITSNDEKLKGIIANDQARSQVSSTDTIRPQVIVYGRYVGRYYYENAIHEGTDVDNYKVSNYAGLGNDSKLEEVQVSYSSDNVVTTSIDQLIDYVDIDSRFAQDSLGTNNYWEAVAYERDENGYYTYLEGLISKEGIADESGTYRKTTENKYDLLDDKDRPYITDTISNILVSTNENLERTSGKAEYNTNQIVSIYNSGLVKETIPSAYFDERYPELTHIERIEDAVNAQESKYAQMNIFLTRAIASDTDANQLKIDNLVEVLVYSNAVGRSDQDSIPGNAMKIATRDGAWLAGYNSFDPNKTYDPTWKKPEDDAYTAEYVSIVPPTGISHREYVKNKIIPITILSISTMTLLAIFGYKQIKIKKQEER